LEEKASLVAEGDMNVYRWLQRTAAAAVAGGGGEDGSFD